MLQEMLLLLLLWAGSDVAKHEYKTLRWPKVEKMTEVEEEDGVF